MSSKIVLLYHADAAREQDIRRICVNRGLRLRPVLPWQLDLPLWQLIDNAGPAAAADEPSPPDLPEEMLLICGLNRQELNLFLEEFRHRQVPAVALKAVLTDHNRTWSSRTLYREISREHALMHAGADKQA